MARRDPRNFSHYWHDPRLPGLSLMLADFARHDYAPHSHEAFVIAITECGGSEFKSRGQSGEARRDRLLVFNPDEPHSGRMARAQRWRYRSLYLTQRGLDQVKAVLGIDATPYFLSNAFEDKGLIAAFLALHRALEAGHDRMRERELLTASFGTLFRRHSSLAGRMPVMSRDRATLTAVTAEMRERHAESLTLEDLGAAAGLTPFQLIGLFKRGTGLTPHAYLTQVRLRSAIRHLKVGEAIADAAVAAGFYDQSALCRHFKRAYGITPLQYLKARAA